MSGSQLGSGLSSWLAEPGTGVQIAAGTFLLVLTPKLIVLSIPHVSFR